MRWQWSALVAAAVLVSIMGWRLGARTGPRRIGSDGGVATKAGGRTHRATPSRRRDLHSLARGAAAGEATAARST